MRKDFIRYRYVDDDTGSILDKSWAILYTRF